MSNDGKPKLLSGGNPQIPKGYGDGPVQSVKCGDRLDFFLVEHTDENTLFLTERDKHLDVMTCAPTNGAKVSVTSSYFAQGAISNVHNRPNASNPGMRYCSCPSDTPRQFTT
ncbi:MULTISPECIES: DUF2867 domain-containing protein [Sediminimonas]|uniref:DUF2867 domain-containing protein n=1 Tax=Sediminimonas TaxID=659427 RepID=UPI00055EA89D|nr:MULTISPECIES: DUF2867 domain-containing protein [Sediminimonas]MDR9486129.1 DUF2867 domain-containing protein [Sediminimonas sp.]